MGLVSGTLPTGNRPFCFAKARFALLTGLPSENRRTFLQAGVRNVADGKPAFCFAKARFALLTGLPSENRRTFLQAESSPFSSVVRFCLYAEEVPHSPFGVDVAGFAGVGFNFFAEAADVDVYGADIPGIVCAPDEV